MVLCCVCAAVLMGQAHIFWEADDYPQAEALLEQCSDVCQDHGIWRCNLAHATFMQGPPCPEISAKLAACLLEGSSKTCRHAEMQQIRIMSRHRPFVMTLQHVISIADYTASSLQKAVPLICRRFCISV